jgi:hypothetical protein
MNLDFYNNSLPIINNLNSFDNVSSKNGQNNNDLRNFYYNIEKKLSIIPVFLMLAGTLGNMLALYVLTRKKLRKQVIFLFFN